MIEYINILDDCQIISLANVLINVWHLLIMMNINKLVMNLI